MADKKVYVTNGGSGVSVGLIAGILAVVLIGLAVLFFSGALNFEKRTVDVNVEAPKVDAPRLDLPSGGANE
jgi:hypothetical protein